MDKYLKMADVFNLPLNADVYRVDFSIISDDNDAIIGGFGIEGASELAAHAINSHDELVENMLHYKQDAEMWESRAVKEASRANDLQAEVERLRGIVAQIKNPTSDDCMKFLCAAFRHCDYEIKGDFEIDDMKPAFILYANSKGA